jgi:ABC-2 type transport system permease protein
MILSFLMVLWGVPQVYEAVHSVARLAAVADFLRSLSMMSRFSSIARGVIELGDLLYFASLAAMFLFVNAIVIELRKAA